MCTRARGRFTDAGPRAPPIHLVDDGHGEDDERRGVLGRVHRREDSFHAHGHSSLLLRAETVVLLIDELPSGRQPLFLLSRSLPGGRRRRFLESKALPGGRRRLFLQSKALPGGRQRLFPQSKALPGRRQRLFLQSKALPRGRQRLFPQSKALPGGRRRLLLQSKALPGGRWRRFLESKARCSIDERRLVLSAWPFREGTERRLESFPGLEDGVAA